MALASVKIVKRPLKANLQFRNIQQEIVKQLQPVGRQHVNERKAVVANFETDIEFGYEVKASGAQVTLTVSVTNANTKLPDSDWTVGDLWQSLDKTGTKPHTIRPKQQGGKLRFMWGGPGSFQPKTRPVGRFGGPGTVRGGVPTFSRQVNHPGTQPRKFSEKINKRLRRSFEQAISRGVRLGSKRR